MHTDCDLKKKFEESAHDGLHAAADWIHSLPSDEADKLFADAIKALVKATKDFPRGVSILVLWGMLLSGCRQSKVPLGSHWLQ